VTDHPDLPPLPPKWSVPEEPVVWVATRNEDYQPSPHVAYVAIGDRGIPRMLSRLQSLLDGREIPLTPDEHRLLLLVVDPDLDLGELGSRIARDGKRLGVRVYRAAIGGTELPVRRGDQPGGAR
jgi:hypothetical protein